MFTSHRTKVLVEEQKCGVCYELYTRSRHIPRMLFCNHTFCSPCLENMTTQRGGMMMLRCPLCRQVSCVRSGLMLDEALLVNGHVWDRIIEHRVFREKDFEEELEEMMIRNNREAASPVEPQWWQQSSKNAHLRLLLPRFLRRLIFPRPREYSP